MPVHIIVKDTRTMDMIINQQVALEEALVPHASRLRIGKSNFHLRSDITSKESTLQLEFWVTATVHHYLIRFKMDNMKHIVNLEYFREMMHICLRHPGQTFDELPFEEEILAFIRCLGHSGEIRKLSDVNINKLQQPWRSFVAVINKCLSGKSTGYDSLRLSQAQILWGMYHKKNVDFAYLLWEDFVYQVEHKDEKKSNEMYYPMFTKVIIHYFMTKDPSILRRNKVNWHYVKDDQMFTTIKLVLRHHNTQQFGVMLLVELTNEDIRNSEAYKEYYAVASGAAPPKTKVSVRKTKSSSDTTITPLTAASTRLSTLAKGKQSTKVSKAKDEGTSIIPGVPNVPTKESDEEISWKSSDEDDNDDDQDTDNDGDDFVHPKLSIYEEETKDEESFYPIVQTPENSNDEGNDYASLGLNVGGKEGQDAEDDDEELYRDVNINLEGRDLQMTDVHTTQEFEDTRVTLTLVNPDGIDSLFETTPWVDVQALTTVASLTLTTPAIPPPTIPTSSQTLEANFSEFVQTNQFAGAVSSIPRIVERYMDQQMNEAVKILIKKLESKKSIYRSDKQRNLYKALVDAYESDKIILDTYGDIVTLKRRRDDADKDEEPSVGLDQGGIQPWISDLAKQADSRSSFNELMDTPVDFSAFLINRLKVDTLTPELLPGPTYEPMKGSCKSLGRKRQQFYEFTVNRESSRDVYSKRRIIAAIKLQIVDWHNYKHLDWITLTNLTVEECFAFNVSLRMFTRSIVIQRRVEDLQLGVESYQKKLNLTKPDMYRSDLKRKEAYTAYFNPRGFIYNRLKGIRMKYLPHAIWRKSDKERAAVCMQTRSSSRLARNQSSNPSASTKPNPKGRNRRRSKQRIENLDLDDLSEPVVTMADQRTMAQLLQAPTEGYEDVIVVLAITADNFELKHGLLTLVQNKQFFGHDKEDPHAHVELHQLDTFYNALNSKDQDSLNSAAGGNFLDKMPRECLGIIESKSKVRYSRNKPIVAKVSTTASTSGISPDVAELKDMVRALLLDKKGQSPAAVKAVVESCVTCGGAHSYRNCPATDGNNYRNNFQEFISQASAVNFNQGNTGYHPSMMSNHIRPPGFPPVPNNQNLQRNNQNRFIPNQNQNRGNNFHQGPVYQPPVFQPPAYQAPAYQALAPQTQVVSKEYFSAYVKANDAVMRNMQTQGQNMHN
nr:hypothetical protein [Tanacetum cinerariifolium]